MNDSLNTNTAQSGLELAEYHDRPLGFGSKRYWIKACGVTMGSAIAASFDGIEDDALYVEWITVDKEYRGNKIATAAIARLCTSLGKTHVVPVKELASSLGFWDQLRSTGAYGFPVLAETDTSTVDEQREKAEAVWPEAPHA